MSKTIVSAIYTATPNDVLVNFNCKSNDIAVSLFSARDYKDTTITFKKVDSTSNKVTIDGTHILSFKDNYVTLVSDGVSFVIKDIEANRSGNTDGNLDNYRAAYAKLKGGENAKYNIVALGDSVVNGFGSTVPTTFSAISKFRDNLHNEFSDTGKGGINSIHVSDGDYHTWSGESDITSAANWGIATEATGAAGYSAFTATNNETVTFTFGGTGIGLIFAAGDQVYPLGSVGININTGEVTDTIDLEAQSGNIYTEEYTGLTDGTHSITITATISSNYVIFCGWYPILGTTSTNPGFVVHNMGVNGTSASDWNQQGTADILSVFEPKLSIIGLGANSLLQGVSVASYKADLEGVVAKAKVHGDVVLIAEGVFTSDADLSSAVASREEYRDAMEEVAVDKGCVFIDHVSRWRNDGDNMDTLGLIADDGAYVHLNNYGNADLAELLIEKIK